MKERVNIYNKNILQKYDKLLLTDKKGVICGPLEELAVRFLSRIPLEIKHRIDRSKLQKEYLNQRMGFVREEKGIYYVNKKTFKKWILRNVYKILHTKTSIKQSQSVCFETMTFENAFK